MRAAPIPALVGGVLLTAAFLKAERLLTYFPSHPSFCNVPRFHRPLTAAGGAEGEAAVLPKLFATEALARKVLDGVAVA